MILAHLPVQLNTDRDDARRLGARGGGRRKSRPVHPGWGAPGSGVAATLGREAPSEEDGLREVQVAAARDLGGTTDGGTATGHGVARLHPDESRRRLGRLGDEEAERVA
ncbi:hypothetical protein GCM10010393_31450 [Streptomyces gobitricini]|uniref:Uncharacterized protein n=1 Tax=Streptomyces gobitricini TaxID=68211 RepID=A0ABN3M804_9ACTN